MITVKIVTASKEIIDELLSKDTNNRIKRWKHIEALRIEIRNGHWHLTNQGIGVTNSGWICDGGHRLEAIKAEGYPPVQFVLVEGLDDEAQKYVDRHAKRSMTDMLRLCLNITVSHLVVAAMNVSIKSRNGWARYQPGPDEVIEEFTEKSDSIECVLQIERRFRWPAAIFAALVDANHLKSDRRTAYFAEQVIRGEMLQEGDPAHTLRKWILSTNGKGGGIEFQKERYLKTMAAVDAFWQKKKIYKLHGVSRDLGKAS